MSILDTYRNTSFYERYELEYSASWFSNNYEHFESWWDPDEFDWEQGSKYLIVYCIGDILTWWDSRYVIISNQVYYESLIKFAPEHIKLWFDHSKFIWTPRNEDMLIEYCLADIDIWYDLDQCAQTKEQIMCQSLYE